MLQETLLARQLHKSGHTWFEYNTETKEITKAEIDYDFEISIDKATNTNPHHHKIIMKENCEYTSALNLKNAKRKFKNL